MLRAVPKGAVLVVNGRNGMEVKSRFPVTIEIRENGRISIKDVERDTEVHYFKGRVEMSSFGLDKFEFETNARSPVTGYRYRCRWRLNTKTWNGVWEAILMESVLEEHK